jgi:predicted protein tyrosine phosphatase
LRQAGSFRSSSLQALFVHIIGFPSCTVQTLQPSNQLTHWSGISWTEVVVVMERLVVDAAARLHTASMH